MPGMRGSCRSVREPQRAGIQPTPPLPDNVIPDGQCTVTQASTVSGCPGARYHCVRVTRSGVTGCRTCASNGTLSGPVRVAPGGGWNAASMLTASAAARWADGTGGTAVATAVVAEDGPTRSEPHADSATTAHPAIATTERHMKVGRRAARYGFRSVVAATWLRQAVGVASAPEARSEGKHVPLAATIRALRRELMEAVREGKDEEMHFALGPIELELQVEVSSSGGGEAGIKFWVLSLGGKGERSSDTTQTLHLRLTPVLSSAADADVLVGHEQSARPD
jgi:hypothetical protein